MASANVQATDDRSVGARAATPQDEGAEVSNKQPRPPKGDLCSINGKQFVVYPWCGFCSRQGHFEDECFKKNPALLPADSIGMKAPAEGDDRYSQPMRLPHKKAGSCIDINVDHSPSTTLLPAENTTKLVSLEDFAKVLQTQHRGLDSTQPELPITAQTLSDYVQTLTLENRRSERRSGNVKQKVQDMSQTSEKQAFVMHLDSFTKLSPTLLAQKGIGPLSAAGQKESANCRREVHRRQAFMSQDSESPDKRVRSSKNNHRQGSRYIGRGRRASSLGSEDKHTNKHSNLTRTPSPEAWYLGPPQSHPFAPELAKDKPTSPKVDPNSSARNAVMKRFGDFLRSNWIALSAELPEEGHASQNAGKDSKSPSSQDSSEKALIDMD